MDRTFKINKGQNLKSKLFSMDGRKQNKRIPIKSLSFIRILLKFYSIWSGHVFGFFYIFCFYRTKNVFFLFCFPKNSAWTQHKYLLFIITFYYVRYWCVLQCHAPLQLQMLQLNLFFKQISAHTILFNHYLTI